MAERSESSDRKPAGARSCPICGKPMAERYQPFCGKRCADLDLHRWLGGVYAVPVKDEEDEDGVPKDASATKPEEAS